MVTKNKISTCGITRTVILIFLSSCIPLGTMQTSSINKKLAYADQNYESYVGNVILNSNNPFQPLGRTQPLNLEFDLLTNEFENLQVRYIHCNSDWTKSKLQEIEYLKSFNQFDHSSFDYSTRTKTQYIQYFFEIDRPILSGNYLVVVHRRNNIDDILITRRMVFYQNQVSVKSNIHVSSIVKDRRTHQQIDLDMNYGQVQSPNPQRDFKIMILQNKNWKTAISNLKPTSIQPSQKKMAWNFFTGENTFPGWNQFRFLDLRTLSVRGINVTKIDRENDPWSVYQSLDRSFGAGSYRGPIDDNNGRFIPVNGDPNETWLEADYAKVNFSIQSSRISGQVYVIGRFNDWRTDSKNLMKYDEEEGIYRASILLKQGYYDYMYYVKSPNQKSYAFEGSHFQSENEYDILVYHRTPGKINDEVVGFYSLSTTDFF